jgi:F420-non-reducing hydrogenase small subunit
VAAKKKLQIALYWAAACGGCDVAVLDTDEFVLEIAKLADIRLWPIAVDAKYKDVEAMPDGELDLCLFHGAIRNSENEQLAKLLRKKSKLLVAFGSCACMGGIPGLANLTTKAEILHRAYLHNPSLESGNETVPQPETRVEAGLLTIPRFYKRVYKLDDVIDVDYVPGCPPAPAQIKAVLLAIATGALPPKGATAGASDRALCDDCKRVKGEKRVKRFYRPWQLVQDPERCLLEQGLLCMGSATRSGCRGCYGPLPGVADHGASFLSALTSIIDSKDPQEIQSILDGIPDFVAIAYRFGVPASLLQRSIRP